MTMASTQGQQPVPVVVRVDRDGAVMLPVVGPVKVAEMELEDVDHAIRDA